ncbi:MAG: ribosomal protein [Pseudomonadota bacterium]
MSDTNTAQANTKNELKLNGLFLFKEGMSTVYGAAGEAIPVTVLRYETLTVSQVKTVEKDGYSALQLACGSKAEKNTSKAEKGHFAKSGLSAGAAYVKELRQELPAGELLGSTVSINSLTKGDTVNVAGVSKGHGFAGVVKRWGMAGGPAAHGSKFHRRPGSSGNRTWPGRVMPGKKFPGHWGVEAVTVKNVEVVDIIEEHNVVLVKGPVPGARNSLVKLTRA